MTTRHEQDVEFVVRARDRASGQFQQVEESVSNLADKVADLATNWFPLLITVVSILGRRLTFIMNIILRVGRAILSFVAAHKLLAAAMTLVTFGLGLLGVTLGKVDEKKWLNLQQAMQKAEVIAALLGDELTGGNIREGLEWLVNQLGQEATTAFLNNTNAAESFARVMRDKVLAEGLLSRAQDLADRFGVSLPNAFHALERLHAGDSGPLQQLLGLSDQVIASIGAGPEALDRFDQAMDSVPTTNLEKINSLWRDIRRELEITGIPLSEIVAWFKVFILAAVLLVIRTTKEWLGIFLDLFRLLKPGNVILRFLEIFRSVSERIANIWRAIKDYFMTIGGQFPSFNLPSLPDWLPFDNGGVVPGPIGAPVRALLHGGETVLPTHKGSASSIIQLVLDKKVIGEVAIDAFTGIARQRSGIRRMTLSSRM